MVIMACHPHFLDLPPRTPKPRDVGVSHVLDAGLPVWQASEILHGSDRFVDVWKFGWGTSYLDPCLEEKLALLARHEVLACPGGTLLEVAWTQDRLEDYLGWLADCGFPCIEVSSGSVAMGPTEKRRIIETAAERFTVLAEVGVKDPAASWPPERWAQAVETDLAAGARWVIAEGRESGTAGLYTRAGEVRTPIVEAICAAAGPRSVIFETPRHGQQAWFVNRFGPEVNLGNIAPPAALGVETLRRGLRADTIGLTETDPSLVMAP
jgi:phosphosulfolactate synthase